MMPIAMVNMRVPKKNPAFIRLDAKIQPRSSLSFTSVLSSMGAAYQNGIVKTVGALKETVSSAWNGEGILEINGSKFYTTPKQEERLDFLKARIDKTVKDAGHCSEQEEVFVAQDLTVWVGGYRKLDIEKMPTLNEDIRQLKQTYNAIFVQNFHSLIKKKDAEIKNLPSIRDNPVVLGNYNALKTNFQRNLINISTERELNAFKAQLAGAGIVDATGRSEIPEFDGFYRTMCKVNATPAPVDADERALVDHANAVLHKKVTGGHFWGCSDGYGIVALSKTAARRIPRAFKRALSLVGLREVHPCDTMPKFADIRKNAEDLLREPRYLGPGAIPNPKHPLKLILEDRPIIKNVVLRYHEELAVAFEQGTSADQVKALDNALNDFEKCWRKGQGKWNKQITEDQKKLLVQLLAYAVPEAASKTEYVNWSLQKGVILDEKFLVGAYDLQKVLIRRRSQDPI